MTDPGPPRRKPMFYLQLIAILLVSFGIAVSPTLFSSAPAYNRPWGQVLLTTAVIALIVFGLGRLSPLLNKGLTIVLVIGALIVPGIIIGLRVVTWGEHASDRWEVRRALDKAMDKGHPENLVAYLREPSGPTRGLAPRPEDLAPLQQYVARLPPEEVKRLELARHLLVGLEIRTTMGQSSQLPDESLEVLCRLYVELERRTGLSPDTLSLDLRQRARVATRVAELGLVGWRHELTEEHPAFEQLSRSFYKEVFKEMFPQPLAPGARVYSRTLGSLPLSVLLLSDALVPLEPGAAPPEDPYGFGLSRRKEMREDLALMKSRGVDFTEEELRDPGLQAYLEALRTLKTE